MEIKLNKKYTLTSDTKQFILKEEINDNTNFYYFTSLKNVAEWLIKKKIRMSKNINTLKELDKKIDSYSKDLSKEIKLSLTEE